MANGLGNADKLIEKVQSGEEYLDFIEVMAFPNGCIGFAIPSTTVRNVVNALVKDGEVRGRPAVGITVGAIPDTAAEHYELPEGLYVSAVSEGSDAFVKGIQEGDIITAVNGEPAKTSDDILKVRDSLAVGDTITFTIWREGKTFDVDVALVERNDVY